MDLDWPSWNRSLLLACLLLLLSGLYLLLAKRRRDRPGPPGHLTYFWILLLIGLSSQILGFGVAVWLAALLSYRALREYFSLVDLRPADRLGVLGAYACIPFMFILIQIDWYGFFIVSIPVYAFIVIPALVTANDPDGHGSLWSVGAIDFGLFLLVYCLGHLVYLAYFSLRLFMLLILAVLICNLSPRPGARLGRATAYGLSWLAVLALVAGLGSWAGMSLATSLILGSLIPLLVAMGNRTVGLLACDLGIDANHLEPGRGLVLDAMKSYLFAAPVVFHVLRWALKFGEKVCGHAL